MRESDVTLTLRNYFIKKDWEILAFDFPQSGTGTIIKQNYSNEKNKDSIIPDLIVRKGEKGIFLETKYRFYQDDIEKIYDIKTNNNYSHGLSDLFGGAIPENMWYGIGIPDKVNDKRKSINNSSLIDILFTVNKNGEVLIP